MFEIARLPGCDMNLQLSPKILSQIEVRIHGWPVLYLNTIGLKPVLGEVAGMLGIVVVNKHKVMPPQLSS